LCDWIEDSRGVCIEGRDARLEICLKQVLNPGGNILLGAKLSEYHTGYRAFSRELLEQLPLHLNSDDFLFDNQMLAQVIWLGYTVAEISCPTLYFPEASSINFFRSMKYGFGCLRTGFEFRLAKMKMIHPERFP
jgi:hypothetical protein